MKTKLLLLLLPGVFYGLFLFCHRQTDGFQVAKIHSDLPFSPEWEVPSPTTEERAQLQTLLNQPFTYLAKGGQSYAFLSQDGQTVLKLFKMHNLRQYPWGYRLALPGSADQMRLRLLFQQKQKLHRLFHSCQLAYTQLKEETGLLYLHLNPYPDQLPQQPITVVDKLGIIHTLPLTHIPFAVQRKADLAMRRVKQQLRNHDLTEAKRVVEQMISCLKRRHAKGIIDNDPAFRRNMGVSAEHALFLDIGSFSVSESPLSHADLIQETRSLHRSLEKRSLELAAYMDSLIQ